eukprot:TRINITY_DN3620_c0_g1_i5.p1 TRINITY_DN3620_c0_g1~~TRINITY_DN3620_c0_g1_i5.p1  ORF type:complete len:221 (+),score=71.83 TRINITY_DN3620_c0_g1_i5:133-795(+)
MLRSLVGSEMCIRDSINAEYGGSQFRPMSEQELRYEIERCFKIQDKDSDGTLDERELGTYLRALGLCPTNAEIQAAGGGKNLSLEDATQVYHDLKTASDKKAEDAREKFKAENKAANVDDLTVIMDMFKAWEDPQNPGTIQFAQLKNGLKIFGKADNPPENFDDGEIDALKRVLGVQGDADSIQIEQVANWIERTNKPHTYARLTDDETHWPRFPNSNYA